MYNSNNQFEQQPQSLQPQQLEIEKFKEIIKDYSVEQKFIEYQKIIPILEQSQSPLLEQYYKQFNQLFPFNHRIWNKYAQSVQRSTNNKDQGLNIFEQGSKLNGKSVEFWNCYCFWVKNSYGEQSEQILDVYRKAVDHIGLDYYSWDFWNELLTLEQDNIKIFEIYCKAVTVPMHKITELYSRFLKFMNSAQQDQLQQYYDIIHQQFNIEKQNNEETNQEEDLNSKIQIIWTEKYSKTIELQKEKQGFESKFQYFEFDSSSSVDYQIWKKYLEWESKNFGINQILYLFQKCLITQSLSGEIWQQYFDLISLEDIKENMQKYQEFFTLVNPQVRFYYAELLEENQEFDKVQEVFNDIKTSFPHKLNAYMQEIQFLIRRNQQEKVLEAFKVIEEKFQKDNDVYIFILYKKAQFYQKHMNDTKKGQEVLTDKIQEIYSQQSVLDLQIYSYYLEYLKKNYQGQQLIQQFNFLKNHVSLLKKQDRYTVDLYNMLIQFVRSEFNDVKVIHQLNKELRYQQFNISKSNPGSVQNTKKENGESLLTKRSNPGAEEANEFENLEKQQKTEQNNQEQVEEENQQEQQQQQQQLQNQEVAQQEMIQNNAE